MVNYRDLLKRKSNSFTLMEILIIVTLITVIAAAVIVLLDPLKQIQRSYDARRKADLDILKKVIEDWYNDKGCYPKPDEICYSSPPKKVCESISVGRPKSQVCYLCGTESASPDFTPYLGQLPCDPEHAKKVYVYEAEVNPDVYPGINCRDSQIIDLSNQCPQWYRVYSQLVDSKADPDSSLLGCLGNGCGYPKSLLTPMVTGYPGGYGFGYGISSSNIKFTHTVAYYCFTKEAQTCDRCGGAANSYSICLSNPDCLRVYPDFDTCDRYR